MGMMMMNLILYESKMIGLLKSRIR
jgi:hypothetical protein